MLNRTVENGQKRTFKRLRYLGKVRSVRALQSLYWKGWEMHSRHNDVTMLDDETIAGWSGIEMAIRGGGSSINENTEHTGEWAIEPLVWHSDAIPCAQFLAVELLLASGKVYRIESSPFDDFFSLTISENTEMRPPRPDTSESLFRDVYQIGLPTGHARVISTRLDDRERVLEIVLLIDSSSVRLFSGEVYECRSNKFRIVEGDESVLVQLNGTRPTTHSRDGQPIF